jgi:hypothetical protein
MKSVALSISVASLGTAKPIEGVQKCKKGNRECMIISKQNQNYKSFKKQLERSFRN